MSLPKRIILIRHGESAAQVDETVHERTPDHRIGLTNTGRAQAIMAGYRLGELLDGETVQAYCSPYLRTRHTLEMMINGSLVPRKQCQDPRLREQEWGHLRSRAETSRILKEREAYGRFYFRFPDGESGADVYDRISTFLESLYRDFAEPDFPQNALIVCHGLTMRLFVMRWFHASVETYESWANPANCVPLIMNLNAARNRYELSKPMEEENESDQSEKVEA